MSKGWIRAGALVMMLIGLLASGALSCGGAQLGDRAVARASNDWASRWLGTAPDGTLVLRAGGRDLHAWLPYDDALDDLLPLSSPGTFAMRACAQADFYVIRGGLGSAPTAIAVFHGVPSGLDPSRPRSVDEHAAFAFAGQATSGVRTYRSSESGDTTQLFVLPASSTWIFATGVAGERLASALRDDSSEPPFAPILTGAVLEVTAPLRTGWIATPSADELRWIKGFDHAVGGGAVIFPPHADGSIPIGLKLFYPSAGEANDAATDIVSLVNNGSIQRLAGDHTITGAETFGSTLLVHAVLPAPPPSRKPVNQVSSEVPTAAPALAGTALNGFGAIALGAMRGRVVLVHFWATWCEPCKNTLPHLADINARYGNRGVSVIGVSEDDEQTEIVEFGHRFGAGFPLVWDEHRVIARDWKPVSMPTTFIVDKNGMIRFTHLGYHAGEEKEIEQEVSSLL